MMMMRRRMMMITEKGLSLLFILCVYIWYIWVVKEERQMSFLAKNNFFYKRVCLL